MDDDGRQNHIVIGQLMEIHTEVPLEIPWLKSLLRYFACRERHI